MIRAGFLDPELRGDLIELTQDGSVEHRLARRANALVLLDEGMSCEAIAKVLFLDDDTIRTWYRLYQEDGIEGLGGLWFRRRRVPLEQCAAGQAEGLGGSARSRASGPCSDGKRAFKVLGEITRPPIELDRHWWTGSLDSDGGRRPRACRSAPQCERRERTARSFCSSAFVVSCSCALQRSH